MRLIILLTLFVAPALADMPEIWLGDVAEEPKIIQGEDANEGEFPFMASLRRRNATPGHSCGASIITSNWALSAAHCCDGTNKENWYLYVGSIYLSRGGSKHDIEKVVIHEDYEPEIHWRNDICLIRVSQPFIFGQSVQQITLASPDWVVTNGSKATISGWGRTNPNSGGIPDRLQKGVNFTALSNEACNAKCGLEIYGGYVCACGTRKEQSTWNGDSGGPLTQDGAQIGLVSFGFRPYGKGMPTVYSRVPFFANWIKQTLGAEACQLKFRQQKEGM